jgi:L-lactate dehydrogenase complex protein LldG
VEADRFLARVERAIQSADLPKPPEVADALPQADTDDLIDLFRRRIQAVNGVFHGPMGKHAVARAIVGIASGHGSKSFMAWDDMDVSGIPSALTSAGLERVDHRMDDADRLEHQLGYSEVDLGITGALAGFAESGSVVLSHGRGRPRMASLVPEVHVAIVNARDLFWTLSEWAQKHPESAAETANLVVVTGPSRTGDIEQILNLGVHGPRHVHVVIVR